MQTTLVSSRNRRPQQHSILLNEYATELVSGRPSETTLLSRLRNITTVFGASKRVTDITTDDVRRFVNVLDDAVAAGDIMPATAQATWSLLRVICSELVNSKHDYRRLLSVDPTVGVRGPEDGQSRLHQFLRPSEFMQLMHASAIPVDVRRWYAAATLTYMRVSELGAGSTRWDWENRTITVLGSKTAASTRVVPLPAPLLYCGVREHGMTGVGRADRFRAHLKAAGINRPELHEITRHSAAIRLHDLRATGITFDILAGVSPYVVMRRAGHTELSTTGIYVRIAEDLGLKSVPIELSHLAST